MQGAAPSTLKTCLCLILLYFSWGGSFLGLKFVLRGFPPIFQGGFRLCLAGALMLMVLPFIRHGRLSGWKELAGYFWLAFFIMFLNGVCQALGQRTVPSGVTAMLYGAIPLWMSLGGWLLLREDRPAPCQIVGMIGASAGIYLLTWGQGAGSMSGTSLSGMLIIFAGVLSFVVGSLFSRRFLRFPGLSLYAGSALTMFLGGLQSLTASWIMGERADFSAVPPEAWGGMLFLTLFTSVAGYLCYYWLLAHTRTIVAVSFAYIDPVVAVALGALFAGEALNARIVMACLLIVASVLCGFAGKHENRKGDKLKNVG